MGYHAFIIQSLKLSLLGYSHTIRTYYAIRLEFMILSLCCWTGSWINFLGMCYGKTSEENRDGIKHFFSISPVVLISTLGHKERYKLCSDWEIVRSHAA